MTTETKETKSRTKDQAANPETTAPVHVVRRGAIAASIWRRQAPLATRPTTSASAGRGKLDQQDRLLKNFFSVHEPELIEVIHETSVWIVARKQDDEAAAPGTLAA
jgi:hypothetical protein